MRSKTGAQEIPKGLKVYTYHNDVYNKQIHLLVGQQKLANRWAKLRYNIEPLITPGDNAAGQTTQEYSQAYGTFYIIWCPTLDLSLLQDLGTLLHECLHVALYIMQVAGIPVNGQSSQPATYLFQCIAKQFIAKVKGEACGI